MTDKPILFSASMVQAILDGRKSQTRRVLNPQPYMLNGGLPMNNGRGAYSTTAGWKKYKFNADDRLYVREAWRTVDVLDHVAPSKLKDGETFPVDYTPIRYESDGIKVDYHPLSDPEFGKVRPGIHMPRWASRLTLVVTEVRVQRLQKISEPDARAEGVLWVPGHGEITSADLAEGYSNYLNCREGFEVLWESINGKRPDCAWSDNPWVVAITFETHRANIDAMPASEAA